MSKLITNRILFLVFSVSKLITNKIFEGLNPYDDLLEPPDLAAAPRCLLTIAFYKQICFLTKSEIDIANVFVPLSTQHGSLLPFLKYPYLMYTALK